MGASSSVSGPEPCAWPLLPPGGHSRSAVLGSSNGGRAKRYWDTDMGTWVVWTSVGSSVTLSTSQCRPLSARGLQSWEQQDLQPLWMGCFCVDTRDPRVLAPVSCAVLSGASRLSGPHNRSLCSPILAPHGPALPLPRLQGFLQP